MNLFENCTYIFIAILYNLFIHLLTSKLYKNALYDEKHSNSVVFLVISGIVGIVISKIFMQHYKKYKNNIVSKGLYAGGIFLIITAIISNWDSVGDNFKIVLSGLILVIMIWIPYRSKTKEPVDEIDKLLEKN